MNNRRINTTARTNTGSSSYMYIGIVLVVLIGVAVYFFWTRKLSTNVDTKTFSGFVIGTRVKGKLSDISKLWKSKLDKIPSPPIIFITDCSNNIVWKTGDTFSISTETNTYTMLGRSASLMNTDNIVSTWNRMVSDISNGGSSPSNIEVKSMILVSKESIPKDSAGYTSLSDQEYVKKIMSYATNEYPVNAC